MPRSCRTCQTPSRKAACPLSWRMSSRSCGRTLVYRRPMTELLSTNSTTPLASEYTTYHCLTTHFCPRDLQSIRFHTFHFRARVSYLSQGCLQVEPDSVQSTFHYHMAEAMSRSRWGLGITIKATHFIGRQVLRVVSAELQTYTIDIVKEVGVPAWSVVCE